MTIIKPIVVSFDALGTLMRLKGSVGRQYKAVFQEYLIQQLQLRLKNRPLPTSTASASLPPLPFSSESEVSHLTESVLADEAVFNVVAFSHMKQESSRLREALWKELEEKRKKEKKEMAGVVPQTIKEIPFCGFTEEGALEYWKRVVHSTVTDPRVLTESSPSSSSSPPSTEFVTYIKQFILPRHPREVEKQKQWEQFLEYVINGVFGSARPYELCEETMEVLQKLKDWNDTQLQKVKVALRGERQEEDVILFLWSKPFVLTNSDSGVIAALSDLLGVPQDPTNSSATPSSSFSSPIPPGSGDLAEGRAAKPSPAGLKFIVRLLQQQSPTVVGVDTTAPFEFSKQYLHIGDEEADRLACERCGAVEREGALYVPCGAKGVAWAAVEKGLKELETRWMARN